MPHTDFDRALLDAWRRGHQQAKGGPEKLDAILRRRGMSTYTRPLRSWSLVLRANDKRIDDNNSMGLLRIDGARIRQFGSPVDIPYPGVSLDDAARDFGVNRTTVSRWADPEGSGMSWWQDVQGQIEAMSDMKYPPRTYFVEGKRLSRSHFHNVTNTRRSETRVWTPGSYGLDLGGEVWSADWGTLRVGLAAKVPPTFVQDLKRVDRRLTRTGRAAMPATPRARVWQWVCPQADGGCGRLVYKLYVPMPFSTLVDAYGGKFSEPPRMDPYEGMPSA